MIDSAMNHIIQNGLLDAMATIQMDETINRAGVSRASTYRLWA
ncbi:hypothetical protein ADILRU_1365 [Leifsonia rubra CMS 76R]|nr:hypothetical protein ADILRU_1365 [Leifsonia rubra CMS 76R]